MSNNISVDGNALSTSQRTATVITDPNILYEINELQRKLDRREMELKRKDKDVIMLQKEIARYQKDMKGATSEVQSIRERNEQLQQSLMNSRLLSQDARDDAEARIKNARIKELEHGISAALHKYNVIQGELDANAMEKRALENENTSLLARIELLESDLEANKKESYTQGLKLKTYEMRYKDRSEEFEELKKHTLEERKEFKNSDLTITKLKKTLEEKNEQISMLEREVKSLKDTLGVRNESNAILREEMEDIHTKKHVLDKKDMKRFQQIEIENTTLTNRLKSMTKSVDLHMELLRRAESDNVKLKKALEEASNVNAKLNRDYEKFTKEKGIDAVTLANMRKDVMVLRKENKEYAERLKCALENQSTNQNAEQEVLNIKQGIVSLARSKQDEIESRKEEKKLRMVAEESMKALRNRISYLLTQLNHVSKFSLEWQEQQVVYQSQINSLYNTNLDLRAKLVNIQKNFMNRHINELHARSRIGNSKAAYMTEYNGPSTFDNKNDIYNSEQGVDPVDILLCKESSKSDEKYSMEALGGVFTDPGARTVPNSTEAIVERLLFDTICAFNTGARETTSIGIINKDSSNGVDSARKKKKKKSELKPYKTRIGEDGLVELYIPGAVDTTSGFNVHAPAEEVEALELLSSLQVNSFLKFVQGRPEAKIPSLCAEKMASLINYFRNSLSDSTEQLGESRIVQSRLHSRITVNAERVERIKIRFYAERIAKQKSILKFVREIMRISDLQITLDGVCRKGKEKLEELRIESELAAQVSDPGNSRSSGNLGRGGWSDGRTDFEKSRRTGSQLNPTESLTLTDFLDQLMGITNELMASHTVSNQYVSTKPNTTPTVPGAIEIKLPESSIDDETLHSVIGLLCGVMLNPASNAHDTKERDTDEGEYENATNGKSMNSNQSESNYFDGRNSTSRLARAILSTQCDYTERILMLNLRGNLLSDLSCQLLSSFVEKTRELRMLDLRGNMISDVGGKQLFDATRRNPTVLYVTQRQEGCMIEGHRELIDGGGQKGNVTFDMNSNQQTTEPSTFTRLVGKAKFALRIDLRDNDANSTKLLTVLDTLEIVGNTEDHHVNNTTISSHATATAKLNKSNSYGTGMQDTNTGVWGNAGIAGSKGDLSAAGNMSKSGSKLTLGRGMSIPNMDGLPNSEEFIRDAEESMRIEDDILSSPNKHATDTKGSYLPIGSYIDEKIRQMQQTNPSHSNIKHTSKKDKDLSTSFTGGKSVNERIQMQTRAVYSNQIVDLDGGNDIRGLAALDGIGTHHSPKKKTYTKPRADPVLHNILNDSNSSNRHTMRKSNSGAFPVAAPTPNSTTKKARPRSANAATRKAKPKVENLNKYNPALLF